MYLNGELAVRRNSSPEKCEANSDYLIVYDSIYLVATIRIALGHQIGRCFLTRYAT